MLLAALGFIWVFGNNVPYLDDWLLVDVYVNDGVPTPAWMWSVWKEHRTPFSKLALWCLWKLSNGDVRSGMVVNVVALGLLSFLLTAAVRQLRGRMSYTDAFFPLALLHWGHAENFLWFIQFMWVGAAFFFGIILILLVDGRWLMRRWPAVGLGVCLMLLPLQDTAAVAYTPTLALGVVCIGVLRWRSGTGALRGHSKLIIGCSVVAIILTGLFLYNFHVRRHVGLSQNDLRNPTIGELLPAAIQFASLSLGLIGARIWPLSGVIVSFAIAASIGVLVMDWFGAKHDRLRVVGLSSALGGTLSLALGLGWARARMGTSGFEGRYIVLAVPMLCCIYCIWATPGKARLGGFVQMCLFTLMCATSTYHMSEGIALGKARREATEALNEDIAKGLPLTALVGRHTRYWCLLNDEDWFRDSLVGLRKVKIGRFGEIRADPPMRETVISNVPSSSQKIIWNDNVGKVIAKDARVDFDLSEPRHVYGVRLQFELDSEDGTGYLDLYWKKKGDEEFTRNTPALTYPWQTKNPPKGKTYTVWIDDFIDGFRIQIATNPATLRFYRVVLLEKP
jgi:hypothetical protein